MAKRHKLSKSSLHWFIRSRPYLLVADLRRRFDLDETDEVTAIHLQGGRAYIGLPQRAGRLLEDLARENRVGMELAPDLQVRTVIGVYAYDLLRQQTGLVRSPQRMDEPPPEPPDEDGEEPDVSGAVAAVAPAARPAGPEARRPEGRGPERRSDWRGERRGPPRGPGPEREERPDERGRRAGPPGRRFPGPRGPGRPSGGGQPPRAEGQPAPERPEGRPPRPGGPGRAGGPPGRGQGRGDRSGVP